MLGVLRLRDTMSVGITIRRCTALMNRARNILKVGSIISCVAIRLCWRILITHSSVVNLPVKINTVPALFHVSNLLGLQSQRTVFQPSFDSFVFFKAFNIILLASSILTANSFAFLVLIDFLAVLNISPSSSLT